MENSPVGYILSSAPIYAKAMGQIRPVQSKQKMGSSCLVHTKEKHVQKSLCNNFRSDQQNGNAELARCAYAAFLYQML